jgi:hypothetical protein
LEGHRIVRVREQRLRNKECVFGVVADHPATEEKSVSPLAVPAALDALTGHTFGGQTQGIAHGCSEQRAGESLSQILL